MRLKHLISLLLNILVKIIEQVQWWHYWVLHWLVWLYWASVQLWQFFLPSHPQHLYQQCKKKENNFLPQWLMFYYHSFSATPLPSLLDTKLFHLLQICQRKCHHVIQKGISQNHPWHMMYQLMNILSVIREPTIFPILHSPQLSLS